MKTHSRLSILVFTLFFFSSVGCNNSYNSSSFAKSENLAKYLRTKHIDLKGNLMLIILQPECTCTIEHVNFTQEVLASAKYKDYKKVVVVPDSTHSIIKIIRDNKITNVKIISDVNQDLRRSGLVLSVDRIFILKDSEIVKLSDMHLTKYDQLKTDYL